MSVRLANGLHMPEVGLGTFLAQGPPLQAAVQAALQGGLQHIDTASMYQNAADIAKGVRAAGKRREGLFYTSKLDTHETGPGKAKPAFERILRGLELDTLDLLLIHWPGSARLRQSSPKNRENRAATWRDMQALQAEGRVQAIGVSNFTVAHLQQLEEDCHSLPAVNQVEVHPKYQQRELRQYCKAHNIAVVAYGSMGCGHLLGHPAVVDVARQVQKSPAQVLLRWGLQSGCLVIPKSVKPQRVAEWTQGALHSFSLPAGAMDALDALEDGTKYCWDPSDVA